MVTDGQLQHLASASAKAEDLEGLVRPLLQCLVETTGLDVVALTLHDRATGNQVWRFLHSREGSGLHLPEGFEYPWHETLCQALIDRGRRTVPDLATEFADHPSHTVLGLRAFVSQPVSLVGRDGEVAGTLCGGNLTARDFDDRDLALFELLGRLVADRLGREVEIGRERLRAERAERELDRRTRFVAAAEQALKTPLSVVRGWSTVLLRNHASMDGTALRDGLHRLEQASIRLGDQVESMLAEARASMLATDLRPVALDMGLALPALARTLDGVSDGASLKVAEASGLARVDPIAFEHMLTPLVENALLHAPGSAVVLSATEHEGGVLVAVEDDGPGVPDDVELFAPFRRGTDDDAEGTGLGLYVVRVLAESSGGSARVGNRPGGGARFEVLLPAAASA